MADPKPLISPSPHEPVANQPPLKIINDLPTPGQSISLEQALANSKANVDKAK